MPTPGRGKCKIGREKKVAVVVVVVVVVGGGGEVGAAF
jgi:hypothetical protein